MVDLKPESSTKEPKASRSNPIVRIVLLAVLVVGMILLVIDRRGRSGAQGLYDQLEKAQNEERTLTNRDVEEMAGRKPVEAYDHETTSHLYIEEYEWHGLGSYRVYCYYQSAAEKFLDSFSLDNRQAK